MTKIAQFDKQNLNSLRREMNELLNKYGASINVDFQVGNMKYDASNVEIKIKAKVVGGKSIEEKSLDAILPYYPSMKKTNSRGDVLIGYNSRRYKRPFTYVSGKDGKTYVTTIEDAEIRFKA